MNPIDIPNKKIFRLTGILFLLILFVPLCNWLLIVSKLTVESAKETANNILNNEFVYRFGIFFDLVTVFIVLGLGICLYLLLKKENNHLALSALILKIFEALLWSVITLGNFIVLLLLKDIPSTNMVDHDQLVIAIGSFLKVHVPMTAFSGIFLGLSMMLFLYLLLKSSFVPKILAGFGIFSYLLIFIYDTMVILSATFSNTTIQLAFALPSIFFQLIIAYWFLFRRSVNWK